MTSAPTVSSTLVGHAGALSNHALSQRVFVVESVENVTTHTFIVHVCSPSCHPPIPPILYVDMQYVSTVVLCRYTQHQFNYVVWSISIDTYSSPWGLSSSLSHRTCIVRPLIHIF